MSNNTNAAKQVDFPSGNEAARLEKARALRSDIRSFLDIMDEIANPSYVPNLLSAVNELRQRLTLKLPHVGLSCDDPIEIDLTDSAKKPKRASSSQPKSKIPKSIHSSQPASDVALSSATLVMNTSLPSSSSALPGLSASPALTKPSKSLSSSSSPLPLPSVFDSPVFSKPSTSFPAPTPSSISGSTFPMSSSKALASSPASTLVSPSEPPVPSNKLLSSSASLSSAGFASPPARLSTKRKAMNSPDSTIKPPNRQSISNNVEKKKKSDGEETDTLLEALQRENTCPLCNQCKDEEPMQISKCSHRACGACVRSWLLKLLKDQSRTKVVSLVDVTCGAMARHFGKHQACTDQIPDWMQRKVLQPDQYDELSKACFQSFLATSERHTQCPKCGEAFETEAGQLHDAQNRKVNGRNKENTPKASTPIFEGKELTKEADEDRSCNRFRCPKCATVFCGKCGVIPYHLGFTCSQYSQYQGARKCRFCTKELRAITGKSSKANVNVCTDKECVDKSRICCAKTLPCGHPCGGVLGEKSCLDCLDEKCNGGKRIGSTEDFCNICWVESIGQAPAIRLECGHVFHFACVQKKLEKKWTGARITFGFMSCPLCKRAISHTMLKNVLEPLVALRRQVADKATQRLKFEGLELDKEITSEGSKYYKDPTAYAMDRFAYYTCHMCQNPYFGGRRQCEEAAAQNAEEFDATGLICGGCQSGSDKNNCRRHGAEFIDHKCKFCCSIAAFFCWGNTHFCDKCHQKQCAGEYLTKKAVTDLPKCLNDKCPSGGKHPPNGTEFILGCSICRHSR